jgi:hypothetical protein
MFHKRNFWEEKKNEKERDIEREYLMRGEIQLRTGDYERVTHFGDVGRC